MWSDERKFTSTVDHSSQNGIMTVDRRSPIYYEGFSRIPSPPKDFKRISPSAISPREKYFSPSSAPFDGSGDIQNFIAQAVDSELRKSVNYLTNVKREIDRLSQEANMVSTLIRKHDYIQNNNWLFF